MRYITEYTGLASNLGNQYYEILTGCGPAVGAIITSKLFGIQIPLTLKGEFKNILVPLFMYWLLPVLLLSMYSYITTNEVSIVLFSTILVYGLCEEIGWRGFLRETLKALPKLTGILVLTILWYIWHLNFGFDSSHFIFFGILLLGSWELGAVADKTNSLLALAAFHSLNNFFLNLDSTRIIILIVLTAILMVTLFFLERAKRKTSANLEFDNSSI